MSNKIQKTVEFKFTSDVSNVTQSVNQLEQKMRNVKMPEGSAKGILSQITKLKTELAKVQSQTKDGVVKIDEADAVAKSGQKIKSLYTELIAKVKQLGTLSNKEMRELFPEEIANQINGAEKAMDNYAKAIKNANKEIERQEEALEKAQKAKREEIERQEETFLRTERVQPLPVASLVDDGRIPIQERRIHRGGKHLHIYCQPL